MVGHYRRKWSFAARWCERIAAICLPYFALTIAFHRFGWVSSPQALWLIGFGFLMLLACLALGAKAFLDFWVTGRKGGMATLRGLSLAALLSIPFVWHGWLAHRHPAVSDVATNPFDPTPFPTAAALRDRLVPDGANPLALYDEDYADLLVVAYPEVGSRRYNAGAERIAGAVEQLVSDREWQITARRGEITPVLLGGEEEGEAETPAEEAEETARNDEAEADPTLPDPGNTLLIEAVARTAVYGFRRDVVVQITAEDEATLVDMRSSSRWGPHDFASNAAIITRFLEDLDKALVGFGGEG